MVELVRESFHIEGSADLLRLVWGVGMRTSLFNQFTNLAQEFKDDFRCLFEELTAEQRNALVSHVATIYQSETLGKHKIALDVAATEVSRLIGEGKRNTPQVLRALKLLLFIHREWKPYHDNKDDFLRDLDELGLITNDESRTYVTEFLEAVRRDDRRRLERRYASRLLPSYVGCDTMVDYRAMVPQSFGEGLDDKIGEYAPTCVGLVPVVLVEIERDSGDPRSMQFQCEASSLKRLIDCLHSALKDLEAGNAFLQGKRHVDSSDRTIS